jgi:hypothetical protein
VWSIDPNNWGQSTTRTQPPFTFAGSTTTAGAKTYAVISAAISSNTFT